MKNLALGLLTAGSLIISQASSHAQDGDAVVQGVGQKTAGSTSLLDLLQSGGWVILPLALMSILTLTLIVVFIFTLRRGAVVSEHFMNTADVLLKKRDLLGLLAISNRHSEAVARVAQRTLDFASKNPNADFAIVREIAQTEGGSQASAMQSRITYLADLAVLAPMVGLLGTVGGIIKSFGLLASKQTADSSRNVLLAGGVSEALVATAAGLILGITAAAFYGFFRGRVQRLISDLELASAHFLGMLAISLGNAPRKRESSRLGLEDEF